MGGPGPIPWSAIDRWAQRHGITDPDAFDDLVVLVRAQDDAYLSHHREKADEKRSQAGQGSKAKQDANTEVFHF